jgi:hypothetical protein
LARGYAENAEARMDLRPSPKQVWPGSQLMAWITPKLKARKAATVFRNQSHRDLSSFSSRTSVNEKWDAAGTGDCGYGRGAGLGRGLGVGASLGVGVGLGVDVGVAVGVAVAVAVGVGVGVGADCAQYLPPVFK